MASHPDTGTFELGRSARQRFDAGQFDAACDLLTKLASTVPENPYVRMDLATVLQRCGRLRASTEQLMEAASLPALEPAFAVHLARGLFYGGEVVAARACLDTAEQDADLPAPLLAEMAHLRWTMGEVLAARRVSERAVAAGAQGPPDLHLHAMLLQFSGDLDRAEAVLRSCVQRWPTFGNGVLALTNLHRQTPQSNHLDFLHHQLQRLPHQGPAATLANRAAFEAALFKTLDDLDQPEEAWAALARCNALMHQIVPYDAASEVAITDALIEASNVRAQRPPAATAQDPGPQPIFVVGMPRSGTTLLDRMLSSHSEVASAGEITDFMRQLRCATDVPPQGMQGTLSAIRRSPTIDPAALGARYLAQTRWRAEGRRYFVDKLPANIRMVAHIRQALPHARIVHMVRDPMEVCFSNLGMMFGNSSPYSYDLRTMAHYYKQYARLARHWQRALPDAFIEVAYADLVQQPEATLRRVLDYCGLQAEEACFHPERNPAPVATPSGIQVRERIHTRGLERWQRYAAQLEPLRQELIDEG